MAELTVERNRLAMSDTATEGSGVVAIDDDPSVEICAANPDRVCAIICNDHATNVIYLGLGEPAVANQGIRVNGAGAQIRIDFFTGAINAISPSGAGNVIYVEV